MKCPHCKSKRVLEMPPTDYYQCQDCGKCSEYDEKKLCQHCGEFPDDHPDSCPRCGGRLSFECAGWGPHYICIDCESYSRAKKLLKAALAKTVSP